MCEAAGADSLTFPIYERVEFANVVLSAEPYLSRPRSTQHRSTGSIIIFCRDHQLLLQGPHTSAPSFGTQILSIRAIRIHALAQASESAVKNMATDFLRGLLRPPSHKCCICMEFYGTEPSTRGILEHALELPCRQ